MSTNQGPQSTRLAAATFVALIALAALAVFAAQQTAPEVAQSEPTPSTAVPETASETAVPEPTTPLEINPGGTIPTPPLAPAEIRAGRTLGFVGDDLKWRVIDLEFTSEFETPGYFDFLIPPLDPGAVLVNLRNRSYAINPADPETSGQLSNRVALARISRDTDRLAYVEHTDTGAARVSVSSLWAPTFGPVVEAPRDSTIIPVDGRGVVYSQSNGDSFVVEDDALVRFVPSTVGTIFTATEDLLVGRNCKNGFCTGVVVNWDFEVQHTVALRRLDSMSVISPDGRWLASYSPEGLLEVMDIAEAATAFPELTGGRRSFLAPPPGSALVWSQDSELVSWFAEEGVWSAHVADAALPLYSLVDSTAPVMPSSTFFLSGSTS